MTLRPTLKATRGTDYRRPGGPWDVDDLDTLLVASCTAAASAFGPGGGSAGVHPLVVDGDVRLGADELEVLVARLAGGLRTAGVGRGDVVAWQLPNGHEAVLLYRACWRLGAVAAPVHHLAGAADAAALVAELGPALVVAAAALPLAAHPGAYVLGPTLPARRQGPSSPSGSSSGPPSGPPGTAGSPGTSARGFGALLSSAAVTASAARPSDVAVVLATAGSTGTPKAVLHTHRTLAAKARAMPAVHGLDANDTVLMPAPLAHISGLLNGVLVPQVAGMKSVLMARWSPAAALELIERERVTFMVGPPTFFVGLVDDPAFAPRRVRSLRVVSTGGAGVTPAFVRTATEALGAFVKRSYGSTEAPTVATATPTDDPARARDHDGRAVPGAELRIVDPATGTDRPAGEEGELWVRGPELFAGYTDEARTREAVARGGWFRTGDLATVDADGWLTVTGRLKDVIIRGGENISVGAVEALLEAHPDVRQAVAVGEPDDRLGERVAVFVVSRAPFDLAACRAWCEAQGAARYTWPERVVRVDELPVLPAGKPDRAALRARLSPA